MRHLVFALLLAAAPSAARAQDACADLPKFFSRPPRIGEWAEIASLTKGKEDPGRIRMAVIKEESREGKKMYWLQMVMAGKGGKPTIIQTLTPWDVSTMRGQNAAEAVMKIGDQRAMKMTHPKGLSQSGDWREFCDKARFVGEESVTVPAGTFHTRHYQGPEGETWASMEAPVWHIVKMTTENGQTMVLSATGRGAKNEITEQPVDMKAMMANPGVKK